MRQPIKAIVGSFVSLALAMAVAACGSDSPAATSSDSPVSAKATPIDVKSTAMIGDRIPSRYTCDGQDASPPLEWGAVPADVRQLALFLVGFRQKPGTRSFSASVEWTVAGLKPTLHRLTAGQLPAGARLGLASDGKPKPYTVCPAKGTFVHYQFELYGVPASVTIPVHFSGASILRSLTAPSGATRADAHGGFVAIYSRP